MSRYIQKRKIYVLALVSFFLLYLFSFSKVVAQSKPWPVPAQASSTKSPLANNATTIKEGMTVYQSFCSPCHGNKGKGDGVAAAALTIKPADHTSASMLNETDGSLFYKISEGRTPMPQYKAALTETQRWELVAFIRTLNKGSKK